ncbi:MAG: ABC transporter substrate binding protein [Pseudomonadota bacterium]|nr:ABC transporter substrate binding protein [Pseudomonadota bacterium]
MAAAGQRVFIVYSYHPDYFWQQDEEQGIKKALSGMDVTFDSYCLDSKKHQGQEWLAQQVKICLEKIEGFQPDVIITCDDNAAKTIGRIFFKQKIPVVFLGLNGEPEAYGLVESGRRQHPGANITGVLERHYYHDATVLLQTILLANNLKVKKLDIITDDSSTSTILLKSLRQEAWKTPWELAFLPQAKTFTQYKEQILGVNQPGHAAFIYNLETLKNNDNHVPDMDVLAWTSKYLAIPAVAFHEYYLKKGAALCGVVVSGRTQGYHAGLKVKQILGGVSAGEIPIDRPPKGTVVLNISVAERLGVKIPLEILLSADIVYDAEK